MRKYATALFVGSAVAAVLLLSLLQEPLAHVVEILLQSKPVPVSAAVLLLLLVVVACLWVGGWILTLLAW